MCLKHAANFLCSIRRHFPQPAPLAATDETKRPHEAHPTVSMCGSHVEFLLAIEVYPFCEMCQRNVNNPVLMKT